MIRYYFNILLFLSVFYSNGCVNITTEKGAFNQVAFQSEQDTFNDFEPLDSGQDCTLTFCFLNTQRHNITSIQNQHLLSIINALYIRGPPSFYI
ncbi:MAG: hypothetical protein ACI936_000067 [Paraglaciecola sp.]|jgi:hypothetical protein